MDGYTHHLLCDAMIHQDLFTKSNNDNDNMLTQYSNPVHYISPIPIIII